MSHFIGVGIFRIGLNRPDLGCWQLTLNEGLRYPVFGANYYSDSKTSVMQTIISSSRNNARKIIGSKMDCVNQPTCGPISSVWMLTNGAYTLASPKVKIIFSTIFLFRNALPT